MISVKTYINGHYLADYRADALLVSTPTGKARPIICRPAALHCRAYGRLHGFVAGGSLTLSLSGRLWLAAVPNWS